MAVIAFRTPTSDLKLGQAQRAVSIGLYGRDEVAVVGLTTSCGNRSALVKLCEFIAEIVTSAV